jgi:hypothetical protein
MAGLVLGASPSLTWQRSDIIVIVNDSRSRCCGVWHAVGGRNGGCVNKWELYCKRVPNVKWFFVNAIKEKRRRWLDQLSINENWYWGKFAKEYVMESCNGVKFVRGKLLDFRDSGCKVLGGSNDSIGGCDDGCGDGVVLEMKCVVKTLVACSFHDGVDAAVEFQ